MLRDIYKAIFIQILHISTIVNCEIFLFSIVMKCLVSWLLASLGRVPFSIYSWRSGLCNSLPLFEGRCDFFLTVRNDWFRQGFLHQVFFTFVLCNISSFVMGFILALKHFCPRVLLNFFLSSPGYLPCVYAENKFISMSAFLDTHWMLSTQCEPRKTVDSVYIYLYSYS